MNIVNIPELLESVLYKEGSGTYRLILCKTEQVKSKFMIVKVLSKKFIAIQYLSCIKGSENTLMKIWGNLQTTRTDLSIHHLNNGDIRIMRG